MSRSRQGWGLAGLRYASALVLSGAAMAAFAATPESGHRVETVQFAKDSNKAAISGALKGDQYVDYKVRSGAGQTLTVTLKGSNLQNYFNIHPPGSADIAMFIGSTSGNQFKRIAPTDGEYVVRVYLMRAAARRNETSDYTLNVALDGKALPALSAAKDALIRGTPFHASGNMACTRADNLQLKRCDGYVIRRGYDGTATLEVRWADGLKRSVLFTKLQPVASDSVNPMTYTRSGDVIAVSIGKDERFEVPDVLLTGG